MEEPAWPEQKLNAREVKDLYNELYDALETQLTEGKSLDLNTLESRKIIDRYEKLLENTFDFDNDAATAASRLVEDYYYGEGLSAKHREQLTKFTTNLIEFQDALLKGDKSNAD